MPNSTTAAATTTNNKRRGEILSFLRTSRDALFLRGRRSKKEKRPRRSNTISTSSNFSGTDADAAVDSRVIGRFLSEEDDDYEYEYEHEQNSPHEDDSISDTDDDGRDFLDVTRRGGDSLAAPTSICMTTYAPNPSSTMTTATFLSFGVQPLAPPAVSRRRASMGGYYRPTYVSDSAVTTDGRTMNRRGTVPPMATTAAAVEMGGYLSSTVDSLVAGHDPATAGLDIDTSNPNLHQPPETYSFLIEDPPTSGTTAHHDDREERRRIFEAKRKAKMTCNPRFL